MHKESNEKHKEYLKYKRVQSKGKYDLSKDALDLVSDDKKELKKENLCISASRTTVREEFYCGLSCFYYYECTQ